MTKKHIHWLLPGEYDELKSLKRQSFASIRLRAFVSSLNNHFYSFSFGEIMPLNTNILLIGKIGISNIDKRGHNWLNQIKMAYFNDCKIILRDIYNSNKIITIDKIQNITSNFFSITLSDMLSPRRSRPLARPRQVAMYLAKKLTPRSLPEIGRKFSNRDHTTVIHAVKTIEKLLENNDELRKNVEELKSLILSD